MNDPDFVNETGVKWWRDSVTNSYAKFKGIENAQGFLIELPDGYKTRVLIVDDELVAEDQSIEGLGGKIDQLALHKNFGEVPC